MKTLRNTVITVLVVVSLGFINLFAMKSDKAKSANSVVSSDPKTEKVRQVSDQAIRDVLSGVFYNMTVDHSGKVNIVFRVSGNKQVEILNIYGYNQALVSSVKKAVNKTVILIPEALEGKYMVSVMF